VGTFISEYTDNGMSITTRRRVRVKPVWYPMGSYRDRSDNAHCIIDIRLQPVSLLVAAGYLHAWGLDVTLSKR
jgi:hypothetical protein